MCSRTRQVVILTIIVFQISSLQSLDTYYPEKEHVHLNESLEEHLEEEIDDFDFGSWGDPDGPEVYRWNVEEYPIPQKNPRYCRRMTYSNVCDPDDILQKKQADSLDELIRKVYNDTPCICGAECGSSEGGLKIGIALLKYHYRPYNEHPSKVMRDFAMNLRTKWNMGRCEDDLLIVIATNDRQSYTAVGQATEQYLSLEEVHMIFLENRADFSKGDFYNGLRSMLRTYYEKMSTVQPQKMKKKDDVALISGIVVAVVLLIGIITIVFALVYKKLHKKEKEDDEDEKPNRIRNGTHSNSWKRKDIKLLFQTFKSGSDKYGPCKTEEDDHQGAIPASAMITTDEMINTEIGDVEPLDVHDSLLTQDNGTNHATNNTDIESSSPEWPRNASNHENNGSEGHFNTFVKKSPPTQPHETDL